MELVAVPSEDLQKPETLVLALALECIGNLGVFEFGEFRQTDSQNELLRQNQFEEMGKAVLELVNLTRLLGLLQEASGGLVVLNVPEAFVASEESEPGN